MRSLWTQAPRRVTRVPARPLSRLGRLDGGEDVLQVGGARRGQRAERLPLEVGHLFRARAGLRVRVRARPSPSPSRSKWGTVTSAQPSARIWRCLSARSPVSVWLEPIKWRGPAGREGAGGSGGGAGGLDGGAARRRRRAVATRARVRVGGRSARRCERRGLRPRPRQERPRPRQEPARHRGEALRCCPCTEASGQARPAKGAARAGGRQGGPPPRGGEPPGEGVVKAGLAASGVRGL